MTQNQRGRAGGLGLLVCYPRPMPLRRDTTIRLVAYLPLDTAADVGMGGPHALGRRPLAQATAQALRRGRRWADPHEPR